MRSGTKFVVLALIAFQFISFAAFSAAFTNTEMILSSSPIMIRPALENQTSPIIADHSIINFTRFDEIPESVINATKDTLRIGYQHTSHGSQITSGLDGMVSFKNGLGITNDLYALSTWEQQNGTLYIDDGGIESHGSNANDLGYDGWSSATRNYLNARLDINVIIWSWCGQVGSHVDDMQSYLFDPMSELEADFPGVTFIYMTGHTDGSGLEGSTHLANELIRDWCISNNKVLFDFEDIEMYDPDGNYFGDKYVTDGCIYDANGNNESEVDWDSGDGIVPLNGDRNWATDWQDAHTEDVDWYDCDSAHSVALNANMKAYAAWWLFTRIAGWNGNIASEVMDYNLPERRTSVKSIGLNNLYFLGLSFATIVVILKKNGKK